VQNGDAVTVHAEEGNFYYRGDMEAAYLPWVFDISYFLDGKLTSAQKLAGKSGELEIRVSTKRNTAVDPAFYENYTVQISITLDNDKCSDIKATAAALANAGESKIAVYTVMPGKDENFSLKTTVKDFAMAGVDISAIPFSMNADLPDTEEKIDGLTKLSKAISDLNDGAGELLSGAGELKTGAENLTVGSAAMKTGISQLSDNSSQLMQASSQISTALTQISSALNDPSAGAIKSSEFAQLTQA
jgi:X-X-X-Leu-X-X-Gly heptad repeat protein